MLPPPTEDSLVRLVNMNVAWLAWKHYAMRLSLGICGVLHCKYPPIFVVIVLLPAVHTTCLSLFCWPSYRLRLPRDVAAPVAAVRHDERTQLTCVANRVPHKLNVLPSCFPASVFLLFVPSPYDHRQY